MAVSVSAAVIAAMRSGREEDRQKEKGKKDCAADMFAPEVTWGEKGDVSLGAHVDEKLIHDKGLPSCPTRVRHT
ncbi:hypothetical protein HHA02_23750 [Cobetia marina]|nr:hypothetical protein HHA02_23750 [Cobetia marina]